MAEFFEYRVLETCQIGADAAHAAIRVEGQIITLPSDVGDESPYVERVRRKQPDADQAPANTAGKGKKTSASAD